MGRNVDVANEWTLDVAEDLEVPGWIFLPADMEPPERRGWIAEAAQLLSSIVGTERWDGQVTTASDVYDILQSGLDDRASSDAVAMFQVWPVLGPAAVTCLVNILDSATLPDWTETDAVVHRAESPHIGPGLQCSTKRTLADESGRVELVSVHFLFDNGEVTLMLSLEESVPALVTRALPGFVLLKDVIRMVHTVDGTPFTSIEPPGVLEDAPWDLEEAP